MFKTEIKYGIITGICICCWHIAEYLFGLHSSRMHIGEFTTYFVVIIPFITLYFGIKEKRDKFNNGHISLGQGIRTGLMISLIGTLIVAVYLVIYFNSINPSFLDLSIAYQKGKMISRGKTAEEIASELGKLKFMFKFVNQLLFGIIGLVTSGFVISFALSMLLKRNHNKTLLI